MRHIAVSSTAGCGAPGCVPRKFGREPEYPWRQESLCSEELNSDPMVKGEASLLRPVDRNSSQQAGAFKFAQRIADGSP